MFCCVNFEIHYLIFQCKLFQLNSVFHKILYMMAYHRGRRGLMQWAMLDIFTSSYLRGISRLFLLMWAKMKDKHYTLQHHWPYIDKCHQECYYSALVYPFLAYCLQPCDRPLVLQRGEGQSQVHYDKNEKSGRSLRGQVLQLSSCWHQCETHLKLWGFNDFVLFHWFKS